MSKIFYLFPIFVFSLVALIITSTNHYPKNTDEKTDKQNANTINKVKII